MSVYGSPGPRNGFPEHRPYRYRGKGYDQLTGKLTVAELAAEHLGAVPPAPLPAGPVHLAPEEDPEPDLFPAPEPEPAPVPQVRNDLFAPGPAVPEPEGRPERCPDCTYLVTAVGHKIACGGDS